MKFSKVKASLLQFLVAAQSIHFITALGNGKPVPPPTNPPSSLAIYLAGDSDTASVIACDPDTLIIQGRLLDFFTVGTPVINSLNEGAPVCTSCAPVYRRIASVEPVEEGDFGCAEGECIRVSTTSLLVPEVIGTDIYNLLDLFRFPDATYESQFFCDFNELTNQGGMGSFPSPGIDIPDVCDRFEDVDTEGFCEYADCFVGPGVDGQDCFFCGRDVPDGCDNGCGADWTDEIVPGNVQYPFDFSEACCINGYCYASSKFDKLQCDYNLLENLRKQCSPDSSDIFTFVKLPIESFFASPYRCTDYAMLYYWSISANSGEDFDEATEEQEDHELSETCEKPPTPSPTMFPSASPTSRPSLRPSSSPSAQPSASPSESPSSQPSSEPSASPSLAPSSNPSDSPSTSIAPSSHPSEVPSISVSPSVSSFPTFDPDEANRLRTCVAVIDESDELSDDEVDALWAEFREKWPDRRFCLLQPQPPAGSMNLYRPADFEDDLTIFEEVNRDNGNATLASDWFDLCDLSEVPRGLIYVALSIDDSGSTDPEDVEASLALFEENLNEADLEPFVIEMSPNEDWISFCLDDIPPRPSAAPSISEAPSVSSSPSFSPNLANQRRTCVAVIDESSATDVATIDDGWEDFKTNWPDRQFCLLQPLPVETSGTLYIPEDFEDNDNTIFAEVTKDNGDPDLASDWFELCNLGDVPKGLIYVGLSIDESGSTNSDKVQASLDLFEKNLIEAGLQPFLIDMEDENWIEICLGDIPPQD